MRCPPLCNGLGCSPAMHRQPYQTRVFTLRTRQLLVCAEPHLSADPPADNKRALRVLGHY
jgi:hypothetical protein